jgi:hypothetical protein
MHVENFRDEHKEVFPDDWKTSGTLFIQIENPELVKSVHKQLQPFANNNNQVREDFQIVEITLDPFTTLAHRDRDENVQAVTWPAPPVPAILGSVIMSTLILLIACFNLTNTAIAISSGRLKEIGIRKVMGSMRIQLIAQFIGETIVICFLALVVGMAASNLMIEGWNIMTNSKLYDWTLDNIDYWVKDPDHLKASSVGSTEYCLRTKTGNCTDFHSLYTSLARSAGLPSRIVYGSLLKPTLNGMDVDASYHCWVQVYVPNLDWLTLDVAVADIYVSGVEVNEKNAKLMELTTAMGYKGADRKMVDYYFGNLDERRVVWSVGRDLQMEPAQAAGPVNALPKMYMEVDGKAYSDWERKFTYKEVQAH